MRHQFKALCLLTVALVALPTMAWSQQLAYASKEVSLRAGPSRDYPVVAHLGAGTTMTIFGCLQTIVGAMSWLGALGVGCIPAILSIPI